MSLVINDGLSAIGRKLADCSAYCTCLLQQAKWLLLLGFYTHIPPAFLMRLEQCEQSGGYNHRESNCPQD